MSRGWKSGRVVIVNARLEDIMDELQRWYDFNVFYSSPELKELRFTMDIMKYKEVSEIFELMEKIKKVSFSVNGNNVISKNKKRVIPQICTPIDKSLTD